MVEEFKVTHKTITVAGRKLTVWKATLETKLKRFSLIEEIEKSLNGSGELPEGAGLEAMVRHGFKKMTYPSLVACTTGRVFTEEECFKIEDDDLELWLATARDLNPTWFPVSTETDAESIEKKEP
jgi:hypothetical protein